MDDLIPWHIFFSAMRKQSPQSLDQWLSRWRFADAAVVQTFDLEESEKHAKMKLEESVMELIETQRAKLGGKLH